MNQVAAFAETLEFACEQGMDNCEFEKDEVNYWHLVDMFKQIEDNPEKFSEAKIGRWLGWTQCAVVAGDFGTLEDMKRINERHK